MSDEQRDYAQQVAEQLQQSGYRAEVDRSGDRLGKQIRNAELAKIPVVAVVGKKEVETQTLSVRTRRDGEIGTMAIVDLESLMQKSIDTSSVI